jgi:type IV secretory pathway component VirB8
VVGETVEEIGAPELLAKNEAFKHDRAREQARASQIAWWGCVFFVLGFVLQAISAWPKTG